MKKILMMTVAMALLIQGVYAQTEEETIESTAEELQDETTEKAVEMADESTDEPLGIGAGISYRSKYYWRGQYFYGAGAGVFFPYVSYTTPELTSSDSLYFYVGGEVGENLVGDSAASNESGFGSVEHDWAGIDYGIVYSKSLLDDQLGLSVGGWYYWYFQSEDIGDDGIDNSFGDLAVSVTLKKILLSPTLSYSQYFRVDPDYERESGDEDGDGTPNEEINRSGDIYISLSGSHSIQLVEGASLLLGGSVNYWKYTSKEFNDSYKEGGIPNGISDITLMTGITTGTGPVSFTAKFNYAYITSDDFDYTSGAKFDQNKFWTSFNVHYSM